MVIAFLKSLLTGANLKAQDVVNGAMTVQVGLLPFILVWGLTLETLHAVGTIQQSFDLQAFFAAVLYYEGGVCALLATGAGHDFFNKKAKNGLENNAAGATITQPSVVVNNNNAPPAS